MLKTARFPRDLRQYPEGFARELYIYRVVGRGIPRIFYREVEERERTKEGLSEEEVAFRFHDLVMFFAAAAASGVIGNLTYDAIRKAVARIRSPRLEIAGKGIRFDVEVSRKTYNRVRRQKNPGKRAQSSSSPKFEEELETKYRLMVTLKKLER